MMNESDAQNTQHNLQQPDMHTRPHHSKESAPGVYTRSNQYQPQELDMLWSGSKQFQKEDRSPVVFTVAGLLMGIVITSALFFLFTNKPEIQTGNDGVDVPVISESDLLDDSEAMDELMEADLMESEEKAEEKGSLLSKILPVAKKPETTEKTSETTAQSKPITSSATSSPIIHTVQAGDTLGTIAEKYYNNTGDNYMGKIIRANNLTNPDSLYIDQRLVIPQ